jgi:micrococcal nuclease
MKKNIRITLILVLVFVISALFGFSDGSDKVGESDSAQQTTNRQMQAQANTSLATSSNTAKVTSVVDGDTVRVQRPEGEEETLRLIGIDTPETKHPTKPVECFGRQASQRARDILADRRVTLSFDETQDRRDRYGRLLAYIILPDGTNFNKQMIAEGYAFEYTYRVPYPYQDEFKQAQRLARENDRGLWAEDTCGGEVGQDGGDGQESASAEGEGSFNPESYQCSSDTYNCSDFSSQEEAQSVFDLCGGADNDVHGLDVNGDGKACESLSQ